MQIRHFVGNIDKPKLSFKVFRYIHPLNCSGYWYRSLYGTGTEKLLALERSARKISVKQSTDPYPDSKMTFCWIGHWLESGSKVPLWVPGLEDLQKIPKNEKRTGREYCRGLPKPFKFVRMSYFSKYQSGAWLLLALVRRFHLSVFN